MKKQIKSKISIISLILLLTISTFIIALPTATAQAETVQSYPFIGATPNPVGVNQAVLLHVGISQQLSSSDMGWEGLSVTIVRPDGQTDTISNIRTDSTGGTGRNYVPTMVVTYQLQTHFPEQTIYIQPFFSPTGYNVTYAASNSEVIELVVQEDPIPYYPGHPLPDEYWTRPINAQFFEWNAISGDWLKPAGSYTMPPIPKYHPYNEDAPETAHILWTKPYTQGGLAGGEMGDLQYEMGDAYELKFMGSVIMSGILFYNRFEDRGGTNLDQDVVAVDLRTGEELWVKNWNNERLDFGQVFYWDSYNYHGVFGYLWTEQSGTWKAYDPLSGRWEYTMTNVPSGWNLYGPKGEIYRYTLNLNAGTLSLWNSSRVVSNAGSWRPQGNTYNATNGIEWTIDIPTGLPGSLCTYFLFDRILGSTSSGLLVDPSTEVTSWAISVAPGHEGALLFNKTVSITQEPVTGVWCDASIEDKIFVVSAKENRRYYGFSLDTGDLVWTTEPETYLSFYDKWFGPAIGYGKFYTGRASGIVTCYDLATGNKLWTYNVRDEYAEILWSNNFPIEYHFLADGKICLSYGEHSPINPTGRGAPMVVLNATTGEEIWKLSWFNNWWGGHVMIGDSIMVGMNGYDNRLYSIGKGPSAITAETTLAVVPKYTGVSLRGTVMDVSPGTQDYAIAARFPNGVPAVADDDMTDWMQYVYMQYQRPTDTMGVPVRIQIVDPAGTYAWIGTATSDSYGNYEYSFIPQMEGTYTIIATFIGSKAYWGSQMTTYLTVGPATPTVTIPSYPGYQGPSAQDVAQNVVNSLPDNPTPEQISQAVVSQLPEYPEPTEIPEYTTIDLIIIVALVAVAVLVVFTLYKVSKLK
jgi:hypothetical protein